MSWKFTTVGNEECLNHVGKGEGPVVSPFD